MFLLAKVSQPTYYKIGRLKRALVTLTAPFWKVFLLTRTACSGRCCRCSLLIGNNWKQMLVLRKKCEVDTGPFFGGQKSAGGALGRVGIKRCKCCTCVLSLPSSANDLLTTTADNAQFLLFYCFLFFYHCLVQELLLDEVRFQSYFRLTKGQFESLLQMVGGTISRAHTTFRETITPAEHLCICLRWVVSLPVQLRVGSVDLWSTGGLNHLLDK